MLEYFTVSFLYGLLKDGFGVLRRRKRRLTPAQIMDLRTKWREEFQKKISEKHHRKLSLDIVVRDMGRLDVYPNNEGRKGISAWFKAGLMDTYHRGVQLGLNWDYIKLDEKTAKWGKSDHTDPGAVKVILIGLVPYENIHAIEWDGDEYMGEAQIYCYFDGKAEGPYESLVFCEQKHLHDRPFYSEVAPASEVFRSQNTIKARLKRTFRIS